MIGTLSFLTPLALWGLLALPIIWWLLRFTPPRPHRVSFPPLRILLSLASKQETPDKTPWWLLLMRLALAGLLVLAVAHPMKQVRNINETNTTGPVLLIIDDGWAAAKFWPKRIEFITSLIEEAKEQQRTVTIATTTPTFQANLIKSTSASEALNSLRAMQPQSLSTDRAKLLNQLQSEKIAAASIYWLSDGLDSGSANAFEIGLKNLYGHSPIIYGLDAHESPLVLAPPKIENAEIVINAFRGASTQTTAVLQATANNGRVLAELPIDFKSGNTATSKLSLPIELRNEIQSISIARENHAGARQLLDDRWRRKTVAIQSGISTLEAAQPLLSPLHYVTNALAPSADLREPKSTDELETEIQAGLSMLILADVGNIPQDTLDVLRPWIEKGGVILRFAGQRLAASTDNLLPVALRNGDRNLGSALSWETPQSLQAFPENSPFSGIVPDKEITVSRQVLAEPDAELSDKTWASLADGTPLVTAVKSGKGLIILFHVTANADWSNLPLSGTFVEMLQRLVDLSPAAGSQASANTSPIISNNFTPHLLLNGFGELVSPTTSLPSIPANAFEVTIANEKNPPGLYTREGQTRAINLSLNVNDLAPITGLNVLKPTPPETKDYSGLLFISAALLFLADCFATLLLAGAMARTWRKSPVTALVIFLFSALIIVPSLAIADDLTDQAAALETKLAYVKTGDASVDSNSLQGLKGLDLILSDRTSAVLGEPAEINIETDNLEFYPLLYWPVVEAAEAPTDRALQKLDRYIKNGGTVFFDLRDSGGDYTANTGTSDALKRILSKIDIPPLEPVPESHVLTRAFYLLQQFPGRYEGGPLWVEQQTEDTTASTSDGVSGIIVGSNDYAAAWAIDEQGQPINAVIPGSDRQREMAFRVGINVVMYVLTGNYKTDQVHVPALLERLGQ